MQDVLKKEGFVFYVPSFWNTDWSFRCVAHLLWR